MKLSLYKIYRQFIPCLFLPLIATAITGIIYSVCDRFLTLPEIITTLLISIHKGQFLGVKVVPIYVLLMGLSTFLICLVTLIDNSDSSPDLQNLSHISKTFFRPLVLFLIIPLALSVETGVAYQLGKDWFGMSEQKTAFFLSLHEGSNFGTSFSLFYNIITGLSLIGLAINSYQMVTVSVLKRKQKQQDLPLQTTITSSLENDKISKDEINSLRIKIQLGVIFFSLVLIGVLYFGTSKLLASITIIVIIFTIPALLAAEKLIQTWQQQKEMQAQLYVKETESITILKAIPDAMLLVSIDGTCLSYMPAKEANFFVLDGDIIQKNLTDFLAPEIAQQVLKYARSSLQTGSAHFYRFPVCIDDKQQYHEARISPIGQTEVLIMVREIANINDALIASEQQPQIDKLSLKLLNESELITLLETILRDKQQNYIMLCLAMESTETNNENSFLSYSHFTEQITTQITSCIAINAIAKFNEDELIILVKDNTSENISLLVNDLHNSLDRLKSKTDNGSSSLEFNFGLLEINTNSPDAVYLIELAKTTFKMAKQKINLKTFW